MNPDYALKGFDAEYISPFLSRQAGEMAKPQDVH